MTEEKKKDQEEVNEMDKTATDDQKEVNEMEKTATDDPKEVKKDALPADDDAQGWKEKADDYLDKYKRAQAELINFQNRAKREKNDIFKYAHEGFITDLFPAMDSLQHSLKTLQESSDPKAVLEGVALIEKEFLRVLQKNGVEVIETAKKAFDPLYHEGVAMEETEEVEANMIVEEVRRGWKLHGRVLRASSVRVSKSPAEKSDK